MCEPAIDQHSSAPLPWLSAAAHALSILAVIGLSCGFALATLLWVPKLEPFFAENQITPRGRAFLLNIMLAGAALLAGAGIVWLVARRIQPAAPAALLDRARRLAPLSCIGFLPLLFRWHTWESRPLVFLAIVSLFTLAAWGTVRVALRAPPLALEDKMHRALGRLDPVRARHARALRWLPLTVVALAAVAYIIYFSHYTLAFHYSVRSGYDLGIKNNIFWNTLHGAPFKASVTLGPHGYSHFARHSDLLVYFLLPIYAFWQRAETLLVLQSAFVGGAALALYALARRHVGPWASALLALSFLLHPAIQSANLFEFHFVPFGLLLFWAAWTLLERGKYLPGTLFVLLTLFTREDVSMWVAFLGAYLLLSGVRPKTGVVVALAGTLYFLAIKLWIMPMFSGEESFFGNYAGLLPPGSHGFSGVLKTLVGNPAFALSTMLIEPKVIYLLQILLPLAFVPMKRPIWVLLAVPGFLITILPPREYAVFNIHFQYSPHWLAFLYPAAAIGLAWIQKQSQRPWATAPALVAIACASIPVSYQFGAVLQQNTAVAGPGKFIFGVDPVGQARHDAIADLATVLPPDAKVACSALTAPQFSSREDDYDMNQGLHDADYLVFPTDPSAFIVNEKNDIRTRLQSGAFGVVKIHPPFAIAKRGHSTALNAQMLRRLQ